MAAGVADLNVVDGVTTGARDAVAATSVAAEVADITTAGCWMAAGVAVEIGWRTEVTVETENDCTGRQFSSPEGRGAPAKISIAGALAVCGDIGAVPPTGGVRR